MVHLLLVIGSALIFLAVLRVYPYCRARRWRPVCATIVAVSQAWADVPMRFMSLRYYYPLVEYAYEVDGAMYASTRVSFEKENVWQPAVDDWGGRNPRDEFFWSEWAEGSVIDVYVRPGSPRESVIVRDLSKKRRSHHMAILLAGVLVITLWALLVY